MNFVTSEYFSGTKTGMVPSDASIAPCCSAGITSPSDIATGEAPMRLIISSWNCDASTRIFMPSNSAR